MGKFKEIQIVCLRKSHQSSHSPDLGAMSQPSLGTPPFASLHHLGLLKGLRLSLPKLEARKIYRCYPRRRARVVALVPGMAPGRGPRCRDVGQLLACRIVCHQGLELRLHPPCPVEGATDTQSPDKTALLL